MDGTTSNRYGTMKTRRLLKRHCSCYFCNGDIIAYRDKKSLAQYEDSVLEYDLTKDEDDESVLGLRVVQLLPIK